MSPQMIPVLDAAELTEGQMKEVAFGDGKVLLARLSDGVYATSSRCTHYGAPLVKGVLTPDGRVVCPWHGACFNIRTGDIEDAPALAPIHSFQAEIDSATGKICVVADPARTLPENNARPPKAFTNEGGGTKGKGVVIVGGGAGAWATVDSLRAHGYKAPITILTKEPHVPIDRTKLSKALVSDLSKITLTSAADLKIKYGTNVRTDVTVSAISHSAQTVTFSNGLGTQSKDIEELPYEFLVLAPGSIARRLPISGAEDPAEGGFENVFTVRGITDIKKIDAAAKGQARVVVIGSSFIAMELVFALAKRKLGGIWVVGRDEIPFESILGKEVGRALMETLEKQDVTFHMRSTATSIAASISTTANNKAGAVVVKNVDTEASTTLEADLVVMGVGVAPATGFLKGTGIEIRKDGGVIVDELLRVKFKPQEGVSGIAKGNIFAIGDVAVYPDPEGADGQRRVEHWNVAGNQGRVVGSTISGTPTSFRKIPVFWSSLGEQLRYCGNSAGFEEVIIKGDATVLKFIAYYIKQGKVVAVACMQNDPVVSKASELLRLGLMPSPEELRDGKDLLEVQFTKTPATAV